MKLFRKTTRKDRQLKALTQTIGMMKRQAGRLEAVGLEHDAEVMRTEARSMFGSVEIVQEQGDGGW